jgi:hypothetical protein
VLQKDCQEGWQLLKCCLRISFSFAYLLNASRFGNVFGTAGTEHFIHKKMKLWQQQKNQVVRADPAGKDIKK